MSNRVGYYILLAVLGFSGLNCGESSRGTVSPPTESKHGMLTMLAIDNSKSINKIKSRLLGSSYELGTNLKKDETDLVVFRFGHAVEEIYSGVPDDEDAFALLLSDAMKVSDPVGGTQYPLLLEHLAERAESASQSRIRIIIAGDALNDFQGDEHFMNIYRSAAKRLALNPKVELIRFWGAEKGTREELERMFKDNQTKLNIRTLGQDIDD